MAAPFPTPAPLDPLASTATTHLTFSSLTCSSRSAAHQCSRQRLHQHTQAQPSPRDGRHPPPFHSTRRPFPPHRQRQALWYRIWVIKPCFLRRAHPTAPTPSLGSAQPYRLALRTVASTAPVLKFATPLRPALDHVCARLHPWTDSRRGGGPFLTVRTSIPVQLRPFHSFIIFDDILRRR